MSNNEALLAVLEKAVGDNIRDNFVGKEVTTETTEGMRAAIIEQLELLVQARVLPTVNKDSVQLYSTLTHDRVVVIWESRGLGGVKLDIPMY